MPRDDEGTPRPARARRGPPPLIWLAAAIFVASLAGSAWLIVLAERHADVDLAGDARKVLKVPLERSPAQPAVPPGAAR